MRATTSKLCITLCVPLLVSVTGVMSARADVLSPPPADCPAGSVGRSGRAYGYCAPTRCGEAGQECPTEPFCPVQSWPCPRPERWYCEDTPRGLCVQTSVTHGSRPGPGGPVAWSQEITQVRGACAANADCPEGARCEVARRCGHGPSEPPATTTAPATPPTPIAPVAPRPSNAAAGTDADVHGGLCAASAGSPRPASLAWLLVASLTLLATRRRTPHL